jgi:nucleoside-diphosphate-sugar epimerase
MSLAEVAALIGAAAAGPGSPPASDYSGAPHPNAYSVRSHFDGACSVFLTGATGYIGSLILEKLLRSTDVGRVYVLVRTRRGCSPADRLSRVLRGPLFHLITEEQAARVVAVAGDMMQPGLGLSEEDTATLEASVDTVLHSAAGERAGGWALVP